MISLQRHENVFVLRMSAGENRFNDSSVTAIERALDEVENVEGPAALVTVGDGKFYSNGLDLAWMMGPECASPELFVAKLQALFARLLTFPRPTIAALNGHAFAACAMFALCHDFRIMRSDRGYFCLPEVDINIPFTDGMSALIQARLAPTVAHEACTTGRRYAANEAIASGIVSDTAAEAEVLDRAVAEAARLAGKTPGTLQAIKRGLYANVLTRLAAKPASP